MASGNLFQKRDIWFIFCICDIPLLKLDILDDYFQQLSADIRILIPVNEWINIFLFERQPDSI